MKARKYELSPFGIITTEKLKLTHRKKVPLKHLCNTYYNKFIGENMRNIKIYGRELLLKELKGAFKYFIKESNNDKQSKGYGLIRDKNALDSHIVASVGYGLAALVIGVEHRWISYKNAYDRANRTLETFIKNMESTNGFFYHFVNIETAKREWNSEVSIIDTGIFICGALLVGEFFRGEVQKKAEQLYKKVNWQWYTDKEVNQFYMGYSKEKGFWGQWDMYAEQLMLYILGVGSPTFPINKSMYYDLEKKKADYKDFKDKYIHIAGHYLHINILMRG